MKLGKLGWLLALLVSPLTFAADKAHPMTGYAANNPMSRFLPSSDYSLGYLKDMFGSMGTGANAMIHSNVTGSFGGFIMGDLFRVFNYAMLIFGVVMLIYMVFTATLKTAHEGDVMGRDWSSPWIMLRSAAAMVLLAPQAGGYCLAQKVVMFIVLMGVAGANAMWSAAVDKMISEDTIKAEINQQDNIDQSKVLTPVEAIYEQEACRWALHNKNGNDDVRAYGPFLTYQHVLPNVPYDTAQYSVINWKNGDHTQCKNYDYTYDDNGNITGCQPGEYNGGSGSNYGYSGNDQRPEPGNPMPFSAVPNNMQNQVQAPLCGGISWLIPYTKESDGADKTTTHPTGQTHWGLSTNDQQVKLVPNEQAENTISLAVRQMYAELDPAGKNFRDNTHSDGSYSCATNSPTAKKYGCFVQAMADYTGMVETVRDQMGGSRKKAIGNADLKNNDVTLVKKDANGNIVLGADGKPQTINTNAVSDIEKAKEIIKQQGWANAGSYFYNIAELSSIGAKDLSSTALGIVPATYVYNKKDNKYVHDVQSGVNEYLQISYEALNHYYANEDNSQVSQADKDQIKRQAITGQVQQALGRVGYDFGDEDLNGRSKMLFDIMTLGMAAVARAWDNHLVNAISQQARRGASMAGVVNPILSLQNLGRTELEQVSDIWVKGLTTIDAITLGTAGAAAIPFVGNIAETVAEGVNSMINWLTSIMTPIAMMLFSSGFLLSIWLPFMPYVLSLLCVFGWLVSVIEMMVAGPIVALGLLSPEGQGVFGKAVPAVMLSMAIFLRPILMVFGFIAAIVAIFIVSDIVNAGFLHMVSSVFHNHLDMLSTIGLIMLYTLVMTSLCNKSFGMMTQISDRVLRWIGGHNANFEQGEMQMLDSVKSGTSDVGSKSGEGLQKISSGSADRRGYAGAHATKQIADKAREKMNKKKQSNIQTS